MLQTELTTTETTSLDLLVQRVFDKLIMLTLVTFIDKHSLLLT